MKMKTVTGFSTVLRIGLVVITLFMLNGCDNDNNTENVNGDRNTTLQAGNDLYQAFVAGRTSGYESGTIERISLTQGNVVDGSYPAPDSSDFSVRTDGRYIYEIGRWKLDRISKYSPDDTAAPIFQYPVGDFSNPQDMVFASESKAYVTRLGSSKILIVNPSANSAAEFSLGEIDLCHYDPNPGTTAGEDCAGTPEAESAVIVEDKLFVLLQRLGKVQQDGQYNSFGIDKTAYIAVIDINTDQEIDTLMGSADGLKGIPLGTKNPAYLQYNSATKMLYTLGRGEFFGELDIETPENNAGRYAGGVEMINPEDYRVTFLMDDGDAQNNQGFFTNLLMLSASKGYVITTNPNNSISTQGTLRSFNPQTGLLNVDPVAGIANADITTINIDPDARLWVGLSSATPGFKLLDSANDSVVEELVATTLIPQNAVFLDRR